MWTKLYWAQVLERAVKTFAQAAVAILTADQTGLVPLPATWPDIAKVAGIAAVFSIVTSIASTPVGPDESPSLVKSPAEVGLDRLAAVVRGFINAVNRGRTELVHQQKERAVDVLTDLGRAEP